MCLTIPKKVIEIGDEFVVVEDFSGGRQKIKSIIELKTGDYVATQQNVAIEKIEKKYAEEIFKMINQTYGDKGDE